MPTDRALGFVGSLHPAHERHGDGQPSETRCDEENGLSQAADLCHHRIPDHHGGQAINNEVEDGRDRPDQFSRSDGHARCLVAAPAGCKLRRMAPCREQHRHAICAGMSSELARSPLPADPLLAAWLWTLAALVFAMVLVGGATRLTDSGLSITEWQPLLGAIPPLNESQWLAAFEKYKTIPEYQIVNRGMSLAAFKQIYWWEWAHRFLGRVIGLVLILPLLLLWLSGHITRRMAGTLLILLLLGALQGALGWYMVKSGLAERTDVSQYRLAAHLLLASMIYAAIIWVALGLSFPRTNGPVRVKARPLALIALILMQIGMGGLVAGLDAGLSHNTFPLMDGRLVPPGLLVMTPWWRNVFENPLTVQFLHRLFAYAIAVSVLLNALTLGRVTNDIRLSAWLLLAIVSLQITLGVWTLLSSVPLHLALLHQAGAMFLLAAATVHLYLARHS